MDDKLHMPIHYHMHLPHNDDYVYNHQSRGHSNYADGFGAEKIYLTGYTAYPPRKDLHKTALGAEDAVVWEYIENPIDAAKKIKNKGIELVLIEQTHKSEDIYNRDWQYPLCFIIGNEVDGVSDELTSLVDRHIEVPMRGIKQSLNVSVAAGVVGYEFARYYSENHNKSLK